MSRMDEILKKYIPPGSFPYTLELVRKLGVRLSIVRHRRTKLGDFRIHPDGSHRITVNASANPYLFLIVLIHEIAHQVVHAQYGRSVRPHGSEWKRAYRQLMLPLIHPEVFPPDLLPVVARHFINPRAAYGADPALVLALRPYDSQQSSLKSVCELHEGATFRCSRNRTYTRGRKRRTRYECRELRTGRVFFFPSHIEVEPVNAK